jgi:hypothetical protein
MLVHLPAGAVVAEIEGPVLAHHRIHRPHAGDVIAPARRASRHGHHEKARAMQVFQGGVGLGRQHALARDRIVDVGQDEPDRASLFDREPGQGLHARNFFRRRGRHRRGLPWNGRAHEGEAAEPAVEA